MPLTVAVLTFVRSYSGISRKKSKLVALCLQMIQLRLHVDGPVPNRFLALGRTDFHADAAAGAIVGRHLDRQAMTGELLTFRLLGLEGFGSSLEHVGQVRFDADRRMGTDQRAHGAVDTDRRIPDRDFQSDTPFLDLGRGGRKGSVHRQSTDRQQVPLASQEDRSDAFHEVGPAIGNHWQPPERTADGRRNLHLGHFSQRAIDGREVLLENRLASFAVGLVNRVLDLLNRLVTRQDTRQGEEASLHDRVDAASHPRVGRHLDAVYHVELEPFVDDLLLRLLRQLVPHLVSAVRAVEQERRAGGGDFQHVHLLDEVELVTGHEIGTVDQVRRVDRPRAETQV